MGQLLLVGFWINSFAVIPYAQLQARGRPDLAAKCHLGEVLPYFGLLYLGLNTLGMMGAAVAFSLRVLVDFALLTGLVGTLRLGLRILLAPALLLGVAFLIATQSSPGQPVWFVLVLVDLLTTLVWSWRQAPDTLRRVVLARLGRFLPRS